MVLLQIPTIFCSINTAPLSDVLKENGVDMGIPLNRETLTGLPLIIPGIAAVLGLLCALTLCGVGLAVWPSHCLLLRMCSRRLLLPQTLPLAAVHYVLLRLYDVLLHSAGVPVCRNDLCFRHPWR